MSFANQLNVATKQVLNVETNLSVSKDLGTGSTYAMYRGRNYYLNCEAGAGAVALTLPASNADESGGLSADIYFYADDGNAVDFLTITAPAGALAVVQQIQQAGANMITGNIETGGANSTTTFVKSNLGGGASIALSQSAGGTISSGVVRIQSCGSGGGYTITMETSNSDCAVA